MNILTDPLALFTICFALFLGGVLKGAIGMGSPVIAIPVMASFFDVRLAVVIMVLPNLMTNLWQLRTYRAFRLQEAFPWVFAIAGGLGVMLGSFVLVSISAVSLKILVAVAVMIYVALRLLRPDFAISSSRAGHLAGPVGMIAGILQGAAGISAPVSASFLNAMRLQRKTFIVTISLFFVTMSAVQLPLLSALKIMTLDTALLGAVALLPLLVGMPVGTWLAKRMNPKTFDRVILCVLALLAMKLISDAVMGA